MCITRRTDVPQAKNAAVATPRPTRTVEDLNYANLFSRRPIGARGAFANIFTSPLGAPSTPATTATTLFAGPSSLGAPA